MSQTLNTGSTSSPIQFDVANINGRGRLAPVLLIWVDFRTTEHWTADLLNLHCP